MSCRRLRRQGIATEMEFDDRNFAEGYAGPKFKIFRIRRQHGNETRTN